MSVFNKQNGFFMCCLAVISYIVIKSVEKMMALYFNKTFFLHSHIVNQLTNTVGSVPQRPNDIFIS